METRKERENVPTYKLYVYGGLTTYERFATGWSIILISKGIEVVHSTHTTEIALLHSG